MATNTLSLRFEPEPEDAQDTTSRKLLHGKVDSYRRKSSFTDSEFKTIPDIDRIDYVTRDFGHSIQEVHNFEMLEKDDRLLLDKERFLLEKAGDHYWDIVLITPKKAVSIHRISQNTEFYVKKILEENYSYLTPEVAILKNMDSRHALRFTSTLEEAMNISKLEANDPFQKRIFEDLQWDLIELKRALYEIVDNWEAKQAKQNLVAIVQKLEDKMLALEEIKKSFNEIGINEKEEIKKFKITRLPDRRVELVWKGFG